MRNTLIRVSVSLTFMTNRLLAWQTNFSPYAEYFFQKRFDNLQHAMLLINFSRVSKQTNLYVARTI